jgi:threonyl-tRNA synthetase
MRARGLRPSIDERHGERMQARVRDAELKRIPYVVVIGKRDVERGDGMVRVRDVRRNVQEDVSTGELIDRLAAEVSERRPE